jgi:starvation-inducible DNA-binding protein
VGPCFRSIHLQLDEVVAAARSYADTVAERAAALGISPDGRVATVAETGSVADPKEGWLQDTEVVSLLVETLEETVVRLRDRIAATEESDLVTQDLLIQITASLEKQRWMFQAENSPL